MLTKTDLQLIRQIFREEMDIAIETRIKPTIREEIRLQLIPVYEILHKHTRELKALRKELRTVTVMLDKEQARLFQRIVRLEKHVGLQPPNDL